MTLLNATNCPLNCGLATTTIFNSYKKPTITQEQFQIVLNTLNRITTGGSPLSSSVVYDRNMQSYTNASYKQDVVATIIGQGSFEDMECDTLNSNVIKSNIENEHCKFLYQNDGEVIIKATNKNKLSQIQKTSIKQFIASPITLFESWVTGSLLEHMTTYFNNILPTANENQKNLFVNNITGTPTSYTRNTNPLIPNLDFTCMSPWNSSGFNTMAGTLVSNKHVIFCKHLSFYPSVNSTIKFITNNNTIVTKTLTKITPLGDINSFAPDIVIGTLDSDIPNTISIAKILPTNYITYFPSHTTINPYAADCIITSNQDKHIGISSISRFSNSDFSFGISSQYPTLSQRIRAGDSGSPCFLVINNTLILLGVLSSNGGGSLISSYISEINNILSTDGSYALTPVDLSSFNTY